jgi:hypothetical protein
MSTSSDGRRINLSCVRTDVSGSAVDVSGSAVDVSGSAVDVSGSVVDVSGNMASAQLIPQTMSECAFAPGPNSGQLMMTCNRVAVLTDASNVAVDASNVAVDASNVAVDASNVATVTDASGTQLFFGNADYTTYMTQTSTEYSYS